MRQWFTPVILVSSLGYFVDIYDLILFSIVRIPSLKALGVEPEHLMTSGVALLNAQMAGMLIGGVLWGILGDRKGRVSVLYGSILLYSLANLANAFVQSYDQYLCLRFLAGLGLAGELGAAVTLVSEVISKEKRGAAVAFVAAVGILGAIFAAFVSEAFSWQIAYIVGGVMGLMLLAFRLKMQDSILFASMHEDQGLKKGHFWMLFSNPKRLRRYLSCILVGSPNWLIIGVLVAFSPEITAQLRAVEPIDVGKAIGWLYFGLSLGDLSSGLVSQWLKSRKKAIFIFLSLTVPLIWVYLTSTEQTPRFYHGLFLILGIANGYWAVLITMAAEQFGTNLRATATTTVPNFIRAMVIPLTMSVHALQRSSVSLVMSVAIVSGVCLLIAFLALISLEETYGRELDFQEY